MADTRPPRIAENRNAWPALARLLAPAAGCDCQMLAVSLMMRMEETAKPAPKIAER